MVPLEEGKLEYTEEEAAIALGLSVEQLRFVVREHVIQGDVQADAPMPSFRPTDLLLIKMLAARAAVA
ncbi:MAG: hypothetical protein ACRD8O_11565 [Bryobacteraceae bacterium]